MKLEVGQFVRTKDGEIHKIKSINDEYIEYENGFGVPYELKEYIVKASYNIIDILEEGDYVNGRKVYQVGYNFQDDFVLKMSKSNYDDFIYPNEIETIVTKEQFEQMAYKVEE